MKPERISFGNGIYRVQHEYSTIMHLLAKRHEGIIKKKARK